MMAGPERSIFLDGIPWAIAVIGWACTHFLSEARERRKEVRAQLDKIYDVLQKLELDARTFHCASTFDQDKAVELMTRAVNVWRILQRARILDVDRLNPQILAFRRAITLRNFDRSNFQTQLASSDILQEISAAAQDLEDAIEAFYNARYLNRFPFFKWRR